MQTNVDGVFAGGDMVTFPFPPRNNKKVNIPHWQMAHVHGECVKAGSWLHISGCCNLPWWWFTCCMFWFLTLLTGRVAALSMMGRATEIKTVPYFWSAMFGKTIRYAGKFAVQVWFLHAVRSKVEKKLNDVLTVVTTLPSSCEIKNKDLRPRSKPELNCFSFCC